MNDPSIDPAETIKIAILTPFGSKEKRLSYIGKSLRDAAFLAKQDLGNLPLQLMIYDTAGQVDKSRDSTQSAINDGAHLIVGPFLSETTQAVSSIAKSKRTKMISFSNDPAVAGNNIFIIGNSLTNRAKTLIKYAVEQRKYRFGIISSIEDSSNEFSKSIKAQIAKNGGVETFSVYYSHDISSLSDTARKISERIVSTETDVLIFTHAPTRHIPLLAAEINDMAKSSKKGELQIIGLSRWDLSKSFLAEPSLQSAWFAIPDDRFRTTYESKFIKKFGYRPHLTSSLAYDAVAALGVLIRKRNAEKSHYPFSMGEVMNINGFIGIDGIFRFKSDRTAEKTLAIVEINQGRTSILKSASNRFQ